jgi:hypothetical protein
MGAEITGKRASFGEGHKPFQRPSHSSLIAVYRYQIVRIVGGVEMLDSSPQHLAASTKVRNLAKLDLGARGSHNGVSPVSVTVLG